MKMMKDTAPTEAVGCTIDGGQEARMEIRVEAKPVGNFNHSEIVKLGDHVEHWLNGVKVVDTSLDAPAIEEGLAKRWKGKAPV